MPTLRKAGVVMTAAPFGRESSDVVDVGFPAHGVTLPVDHGYLLFAALCEAVPRLSHEPGWALHLVDGKRDGTAGIRLGPASMVQLRLPARDLGEALSLTGRDLSIGTDRVRLGRARIKPLAPSSRLRSAVVTVPGCSGSGFESALRRELATLPLGQDVASIEIEVGRERLLRARARTVIGFPVELSGLRPRASLCLQARGLGARHHMGAGVFTEGVSA